MIHYPLWFVATAPLLRLVSVKLATTKCWQHTTATENKSLKTSFRSERHDISSHMPCKVWKGTNGTNAQIIGCETCTPVDRPFPGPKNHLIAGVDPSKTEKNRLSQVG